MRDAGNLLTRAGFMLPGVDVDEYTVRYKNRKFFFPLALRALLFKACQLERAMYPCSLYA